MKNLNKIASASVLALAFSTSSIAGVIIGDTSVNTIVGPFDDGSWDMIANDWHTNGTTTTPGGGGQAFDAEYLFAKTDGNTLYIGLQTGFDVSDDGAVDYGNKTYHAGDIALSFDGDSSTGTAGASTWEFGIDLGFYSEGYNSGTVLGTDPAGIYAVTTWNNEVVLPGHASSNPYAIEAGSLSIGAADYVSSGSGIEGVSHYTWVAFNINDLNLGYSADSVDVHWTMSCGNDAINGSYSVPEPMTLSLLGLGLLSLGLVRRRKI
jgi:hypothetical protein